MVAALDRRSVRLFWAAGLCSALILFAALAMDEAVLALLPLLVLGVGAVCFNYERLFYLFFALLPFSVEVYLPNGLGTDLPSEPIMWALTGVALLLFLWRFRHISSAYVRHPITVLLLLHLFWIGYTTLFSSDPLISAKFLIAKIWYVVPFFFLAIAIVRNPRAYAWVGWILCISLTMASAYVVIKHAGYGFSFKDVNRAVTPFFRNHVNYACILVIFLPHLWFLWVARRRYSPTWWVLAGVIAYLLVAIYLSYTRAAHVSVFLAIGAYVIVRFRLMKYAILATIMVTIVGSVWLLTNDRYLNFAPEYEKTITHYKFDNLIAATAKGQDISTMERVYRWVSGVQMIRERPIVGFGPGTFYSNYKAYALTSFKTYVSHNPDRSGIHNYYLMTFVEQGFVGFLLIVTLCFYALIRGEVLYHRLVGHRRFMVMAAVLTLVIINAILIINDMLEADKVGPFFFLSLAVIVTLDIRHALAQDKSPRTA